MSEHRIELVWKRETPEFKYETYDRSYEVRFEGGCRIDASAAPEFKGRKELPNPEELFVAALSGCHMLTFLAIAARSGLVVDRYDDEGIAYLEKDSSGQLSVVRAILRPKVKLSARVEDDKHKRLHHKAHEACFIARAVKCEVLVEPTQV